MEKVRNFLVDRIKSLGIKQSVIAKRTGLTENTISRILIGNRNILADEFFKICCAIDIQPCKLGELMKEFSFERSDTDGTDT